MSNKEKPIDISIVSATYNRLHKKYSKMTTTQREEVLKEISQKPNISSEGRISNFIQFCVNNNLTFKKREIKKNLSFVKEYVNTNKGKNTCLKGYNYERDLGAGTFGNVILASKGRHKYAIKVIGLENYSSTGYLNFKNINNEIKLTREMSNLGVGPKFHEAFYCFNNNNSSLYIVLEYMTEGSLEQWKLKTGKQLPSDLKKDLKDKLNLVHKNGIYHLDIAERNILLSNKNGKLEVYLGDFGISISKEQLLQDHSNRNSMDLLNILSEENIDNIEKMVTKSMIYLHSFKF